jgi:integrase
MTIDIRYVNELGRDRYKVRMVVPPKLRPIIHAINLTRVIKEADQREAKAKLNIIVGEFESILADARRAHRGEPEPRYGWPADPTNPFGSQIRRYPPSEGYLDRVSAINAVLRAENDKSLRRLRGELVDGPVTFTAMVESWFNNRKPRASRGMFESKMTALAKFLGHEDMRRVTRDDLVRFRDHLLTTGIKPITVKNYLLIVKTIFNFAHQDGKIPENPAPLVKFAVKKDPTEKRQGFTREERILILTEARKAAPLIRWAVWVSYFSGCRLSEITQAKTTDLRFEGDCLVLSTGTKTEGSVRRFPLHSAILREGFADYWKRQSGQLFPVKGNHSLILNKWLRDLGIEDRRKVFHSLRHQFKTLCREAKIEREIHDAITGHRDGSASSDYGDYPIPTMREAIERISDPTH